MYKSRYGWLYAVFSSLLCDLMAQMSGHGYLLQRSFPLSFWMSLHC